MHNRKNIISLSLLLATILFAIGIIYVGLKENAGNRICFNEICSKNKSISLDQMQLHGDYVELYNPSMWTINLQGYVISDENQDWILEGKRIAPGGYLVLAELPFGISSQGEELILYGTRGQQLDRVVVPSLEEDTVYARETAGKNWKKALPSPGGENLPENMLVEEPVFSKESGFYADSFELMISCESGEQIFYSLDGSIPDYTSLVYEGAIPVYDRSNEPNVYNSVRQIDRDWMEYQPPEELVDKAMVVRAVSINEFGRKSNVVTKTYFVNLPEYEQKSVVSLVADPDDLFGDNGIYVTGKEYDDWYLGGQVGDAPDANYLQHGREYEIPCSVTLLEEKREVFEQNAGIRIQGASSREDARKNFSVYARKEYSDSRYFRHDLFKNGVKTHSFLVRSGFVDVMMQSIVEGRKVDTQAAFPVTVFLNGELWKDYFIKEKYSEDYYAQKHYVEKDGIILSETVPDEIYDFLAQNEDFSNEQLYEQLCDKIDINNFIDYYCVNIYLCNMDVTEKKNCKMWKSPKDGKWRWSLYDLDACGWNYSVPSFQIDSFSERMPFCGDNTYNNQPVYVALKKNEKFCQQFVLTFMDFANEIFSPEQVEDKLKAQGLDLEWNQSFFLNRYDYMVKALAREFDLKGTLEEIEITVSDDKAGSVSVNSIFPEMKNGSWQGKYYTDYSIRLRAIAQPGYEFLYWTDGDEVLFEEEIEVEMKKGGRSFEAVFSE